MTELKNKEYTESYLSESTEDTLRRLILWNSNCGLGDFPQKLTIISQKLNSVIQALNLKVERNIPYMTINCIGCVDKLTRIFIRDSANFEMKEMMLQIDGNLTNFADLSFVSHLLDLYECGGERLMDESDNSMNGQIVFDYNFREMAIIDIFLDVAFFNSYSFLKQLSPNEKRAFSMKKYEYFKNRKLESFFEDVSNNKLNYYSFAFSCHSNDAKVISTMENKYEIDIDKYIDIWKEFINEYYPNNYHIEKSVKDQLDLRINNHISPEFYKNFEGYKAGVYFLLRTERKNIPQIYEKEICTLFGITECTVGQLTIIKMSDFYKYEHLFKNAGVSAFKVVVNS